MTVVLDESGMADVSTPIVVQEFCDHGGILYKVLYSSHDRLTLQQGLFQSTTCSSSFTCALERVLELPCGVLSADIFDVGPVRVPMQRPRRAVHSFISSFCGRMLDNLMEK